MLAINTLLLFAHDGDDNKIDLIYMPSHNSLDQFLVKHGEFSETGNWLTDGISFAYVWT